MGRQVNFCIYVPQTVPYGCMTHQYESYFTSVTICSSHHMRELGVIQQPKMLLADDFKAYSKLKVENHAFNRAALPGHYKVKEYCPLVFRALRDRFGVSEVCRKCVIHK